MDSRKTIAAAAATGLLAAPLTGAAALAADAPPDIAEFPLQSTVQGGTIVGTQLARIAHTKLVRSDARLAERLQQLGGHAPSRRALRRMDNVELRREGRVLRKRLKRLQASSAPSGALSAIAACESGGDPHAIGGGGAFRGKYQFTFSTWSAVGGHGDPAAAPEAEQDMRAAQLYATAGAGQWPVCGR